MATAGSVQGHGARFAAACDVLSRYVKAASAVATTTTTVEQPRPAAAGTVVAVLPLMPGADLSTTQEEEPQPRGGGSGAEREQLTISYGARVVVLDDVPADKAAALLRLAAAAQQSAAPRVLRNDDLLPMARNASLRQFMEKRKGRVAKRGSPYSRPADAAAAAVASSFPDHLALTL
ncbi:unnamed protein product [Miscanthus lutarioriparius]|uniref:Protein TIFY n=1 Tax=Miscanthus lutarioriparius TaxID=422564 RepID=A0A811MUN6_9POAL|nr:unnamed protein product [Miscanthus lutarioriparius]